ncbi:hypothetical protein EAF64_06460 [Halorientalis pallida]|uniref:Uncharacterized protein n=1 Tax=Halorientalis pallida TaxID=2479928 RepID=A0A498KXY4_9EURY|nr:hypothetical protein EAF64_06460 [Halorientalis pallida]
MRTPSSGTRRRIGCTPRTGCWFGCPSSSPGHERSEWPLFRPRFSTSGARSAPEEKKVEAENRMHAQNGLLVWLSEQ